MIRFDDTDWTEEQALERVQVMIDILTDGKELSWGLGTMRKTGEKRLTTLLRAIYEARKANAV
jgi:hypothetical protein